jgi:hypothetical protein
MIPLGQLLASGACILTLYIVLWQAKTIYTRLTSPIRDQ